MAAGKKFDSFKEFWPDYLRLHSKPITRAVHYAGTSLGIAAAVAGIAIGAPGLIIASPFIIYGILFPSHFIFEKNRPATLKNPLMSVGGDFKMFFCWLTGNLKGEFKKHGLDYTGQTGDNKNATGITTEAATAPKVSLLKRIGGIFHKHAKKAVNDNAAAPAQKSAPEPKN